MHLEIPHKSTQAAAVARVKQSLEEMRSKILENATIAEEKWDGNTLTFDVTAQGQRVTGTLLVAEKDFIIDAKLPMMLRLFEGRIEQEISNRIKALS
jgi:hypothetical protein